MLGPGRWLNEVYVQIGDWMLLCGPALIPGKEGYFPFVTISISTVGSVTISISTVGSVTISILTVGSV